MVDMRFTCHRDPHHGMVRPSLTNGCVPWRYKQGGVSGVPLTVLPFGEMEKLLEAADLALGPWSVDERSAERGPSMDGQLLASH